MSESKLLTIQTRNNLNEVYRDGDPGPGGAYHVYNIYKAGEADNRGDLLNVVMFQKGPRNEPDSWPGVLDGDLLEIVRDRLRMFQVGPFACRENACALTHIEEALMWMNRRAEERAARGVLGTTQK